jgi:hypothetical protein
MHAEAFVIEAFGFVLSFVIRHSRFVIFQIASQSDRI